MNKYFNHRNIAWGFSEKIWSVFLDLITLIFFAKLLGPEVLGQYALLMLLVGFSTVINEAGSADAVIREKENKRFESTIFFINVTFALIYTFIVFVTADLVGDFFNFPGYRTTLVYMLPLIILGSSIVVPTAVLKRSGEFHVLSKRNILAGSFGKIVGLLMAFTGFGIESLIFMALSTKLSEVFLIYYSTTWRPIYKFDLPGLNRNKHFIIFLNATKILNYFSKRLGIILVGQFFGPLAVGWYDLASKLMRYALKFINGVMLTIFYSDIVDNPKNLDERHRDMTLIMSFLYYPMIAFIVLTSEFTIIHLFGSEWRNASGVLVIMFITLRILSQASIASHILKSKGHSKKIFFSFSASIIIFLLLGFLVAHFGNFEYIAISYLISIIVLMFLLYFFLKIVVSINYFSCIKADGYVLSIVVLHSSVMFICQDRFFDLSDIFSFTAYVTVYIATFSITAFICLRDAIWALRKTITSK